jgi:hypothetical protein
MGGDLGGLEHRLGPGARHHGFKDDGERVEQFNFYRQHAAILRGQSGTPTGDPKHARKAESRLLMTGFLLLL